MSAKVDDNMIVVERHVVGGYEFIGIIFREGEPDDQRKFLIAVNGELYRVLYPDLESAMAGIVAEKARSPGTPLHDGGPAFPREDYQTDNAPGQRGMSLRDWYAGQALAGIVSQNSCSEPLSSEEMAWLAFKAASEMIKARLR